MRGLMTDETRERLAVDFEAQRAHLFGVAYRMLASAADAEDVLQDAYLRWQGTSHQHIESPRVYLTTVVMHLCLDVLTSARRRRETYVGSWLPEPIDTARVEPLDHASLSLAFLLVLETLSPLERAAFILREVFDYEFAEIGRVLERDEEAIRKLVQRARGHVAERRPRFAPTPRAHRQLLEVFLHAVSAGDLGAVEALLAADVRAVVDGGGRVTAARNEIVGREGVARYLAGMARKSLTVEVTIGEVNGSLALVLHSRGQLFGVAQLETDGEMIYAVHLVLNPDKLGHVAARASVATS